MWWGHSNRTHTHNSKQGVKKLQLSLYLNKFGHFNALKERNGFKRFWVGTWTTNSVEIAGAHKNKSIPMQWYICYNRFVLCPQNCRFDFKT